MHVRCPHCHNAIEIAGDQELKDISCPSCGSNFVLLHETESWSRETESGSPALQWLHHFQLLDKLGTGGFGTVWKAHDTKLDRLVAVKFPRRSQVSPAEQEQFLREARAAAQLQHPNIVAVHEVGRQESGDLYIVSDFVQGTTLADRLTAGPFTPREAAELTAQIADALHHAHEQGVIHRDLKPSNIMLERSDEGPNDKEPVTRGQRPGTNANGQLTPKLLDFGLAKREAGEITMTIEGKVLGTPAYMSPEQARGEGHTVDRRTDVYSLGVILFELLTGELPFRGKTPMLLDQVLNDDPPSPRKLNARIPRDLETICLKCLEKDPRRRYDTSKGVADELRRYLEGRPIQARPISGPERAVRWCRRNPVPAALLTLFIGTLVTGTVVSSYFAVASRTAREETRQKLRDSLLAQARAGRFGDQVGRRFEGLRALKEAVAIRPGLDLRDEAIACMALIDLRVAKEWEGCPDSEVTTSLIFDSKLERYARSDDQGNISVRRVADDHEIVRLPSPGRTAWTLQFSPNAERLAVSYHELSTEEFLLNRIEDIQFCLWDLASGKKILDLARQMTNDAVDFSPDGLQVAVAHRDGSIRLFGTSDGNETRRLTGGIMPSRIRFQPQGRQLAVCGRNRLIEIRDVATGSFIRTLALPGRRADHPAWHPHGELLAVSDGSRISIWNTSTGILERSLEGHSLGDVDSLAFNHAGDLLASSAKGERMALWCPYSGKRLLNVENLDQRGSSQQLQFSPDDKLLGYNIDGSKVQLWEVARGRECLQLFGTGYYDTAFHPNGRMVVAASDDKGMRLWDLDFAKPVANLPPATSVHFHPSGDSLIYSWGAGHISRLPIEADQETIELRPPTTVWPAKASGYPQTADLCGTKLAIGGNDGKAVIFDCDDPANHILLSDHPQVNRVSISADGTWIATGTSNGWGVKIWNAKTGAFVCELPEKLYSARPEFSPNGQWLATGTSDEFCFWEVGAWKSGRRIKRDQRNAAPGPISFSPDGSMAAIASAPDTLKLVDVANGDVIATLTPPDRQPFNGLRFSQDGTLLAVSAAGVLQVWNLRAIREELARMRLDWDQRPFPPQNPIPTSPLVVRSLPENVENVNAQDFATRAEAACRQNQRFEAIVNWRLARQAAPSDANYWYCEALTLVSAGELPAYRHVCDEALQQFRNSDIATCSRTAQIAALGPDAVSSDRWAQVRALAQRAVDAEPGNADHAARLGAVCYRAGDYQAAIEHLKRALPQPDTNGAAVQSENQARRLEVVATVWTRPFLAMAHYRQNDPVEAQRWLDLAEQSKKENSDIRSSADWGDWLIWSVLLQEAHVLVPATPNATAETNAS